MLAPLELKLASESRGGGSTSIFQHGAIVGDEDVSAVDGVPRGSAEVGSKVGLWLGLVVDGDGVRAGRGACKGLPAGATVGEGEGGRDVGSADREADGSNVDAGIGAGQVGAGVGAGVGATVGGFDTKVELSVGVGIDVGENVGPLDGFSVSTISVSMPSTVWVKMYASASPLTSNRRRSVGFAARAIRSADQLPEFTFRENNAAMRPLTENSVSFSSLENKVDP